MTRVRKLSQMPIEDRPREKLHKKGAPSLSDFELMEVLIGTGAPGADVGYIARRILKLLSLGTENLTYENLTAIKGVNIATAAKILASLELVQRHLIRDKTPILTQDDMLARLNDIRTRQQENFVCMTLDGGQRLIALRTITVGVLDMVIAHPREVYTDAIADRAASIVIAHNHPSGDSKPSQKDNQLTQNLAAAGQLIGIPLHDHLIVTKTDYFSYRKHHML